MAGTANAAAKTEMIDLTKLSPDQLMQIKQEFEQVSVCQSRVWVLLTTIVSLTRSLRRWRETDGRALQCRSSCTC